MHGWWVRLISRPEGLTAHRTVLLARSRATEMRRQWRLGTPRARARVPAAEYNVGGGLPAAWAVLLIPSVRGSARHGAKLSGTCDAARSVTPPWAYMRHFVLRAVWSSKQSYCGGVRYSGSVSS